MDCKVFDAQFAYPKGKLKTLQKNFVRLRIVDMNQVDVGLFHFDFDTTFAIFVMNHKEQIYLRYGGRDDSSPTAYLSMKSLNHTLETGLEVHERWRSGELKLKARAPKKLANTYPEVQRIAKQNKCVHCHHLASAEAEESIKSKGFERKRDVWIYPDPRNLGVDFDVTRGLQIKRVAKSAKSFGLKRSDIITSVGEEPVYTFTDLQYRLHKLPVDSKEVTLGYARKEGGKLVQKSATLELDEHWRVTDINRRSIGHKLPPFPEFWARPLSSKEKGKLGLKKDGFASRVTKFWVKTNGQRAGMRPGDIVYEVNGVRVSELAKNVMIHIRLNYKVGDQITVKYLRKRRKMSASFKLRAKAW